MKPCRKGGHELTGAQGNNAKSLADQGLLVAGGLRSESEWGGEGVHKTKGLGTSLLGFAVSSPPLCWAEQDGSLVRSKSGMSRKYNLLVTLENEEPEDATHLPCEVRFETSTLCTATQSPSLKVPVAPGPYCNYSIKEQLYW